MSLISFIILNYNGYEETRKLVDSIAYWDKSKLDFSVIIVDNCSTDNSFNKLQQSYSENSFVDVISSKKNGGYSYGNNYGVKFAIEKYNPKYIAISNPDVEIEQDMICNLLDTFDVDCSIGMCAPVMRAINGNYNIYSQKLPTYHDDLKACSLHYQSETIIKEGYKTLDSEGNMIITEMLPGSFFVIRTDCFSQVGMLDEHVFLYCEERIIGKKLKDAGFIAITRADLFFIHAHAITIRKAISTINSWKIILQSRLYYQKEYEKVSKVKLIVLKAAMTKYLAELRILLYFNELKACLRSGKA